MWFIFFSDTLQIWTKLLLHHTLQGPLKGILSVANAFHQLKRCDNKITRTITNKYHNECWPPKELSWETTPSLQWCYHAWNIFGTSLLELCLESSFYKPPKKTNCFPLRSHLVYSHCRECTEEWVFNWDVSDPVWSRWYKICHQWNLPVSDFLKQNLSIQVFMNCLLKFNKQFMNCSASSKID